MILNILILIFGVFCCSTAVIFIKAGNVDPVGLAAFRLLIAALVLSPFAYRDFRRNPTLTVSLCLKRSVFPGFLLAVHFVTWIIASRLTPAANAALIVNLVPLAIPFMLYALLKEKLTPMEIVGTLVALSGMFVLSAADFRTSKSFFTGDLLCFASMLFLSLYLALGRKNQKDEGIWIYVTPLYAVAGIMCLVMIPIGILLFDFENPFKLYSMRESLLILGLAIVPTIFGHSILNMSMKKLRGQLVGIVNMWQFVFAGIMAFLLLGEKPKPMFYPACLLVIAGSLISMKTKPKSIEEKQCTKQNSPLKENPSLSTAD